MQKSPARRPGSAVNIRIASAGAVAMLAVLAGLSQLGTDPFVTMVACLAMMVAPIALHDLLRDRVHLRAGIGRPRGEPMALRLERVGIKLLGLWATFAAVALAYWAFPEYQREFYAPFFRLVAFLAPPFLLLAVPYVFWVDGRMRDPRDGCWLAGSLLLGIVPRTPEQRATLREYALGWIIKAFFLPLMVSFFHDNIVWFSQNGLAGLFSATPQAATGWLRVLFTVDVAFASVGYLITLRLLDTHIRSTNPFALGWVAAIVCYHPFWALIQQQYLRYDGGGDWQSWLAGSPLGHAVWAAMLLALVFVYSWSTVAFGLRFSNLTHRGIVTDGPYALTKHPAYLSKNLFWWMSAAPLAGAAWDDAARQCLLMALVSGIYLVRARTEERHLSADPAYRAYAAWIAEHGMFARARRQLGMLGSLAGGAIRALTPGAQDRSGPAATSPASAPPASARPE